MTFEKFIGEVQHRARLPSTGDALRATRATLETLCQRLTAGERKDLAAQLAHEIAHFLQVDAPLERLSMKDFFERVSEREEVPLPTAVYHARVVIEVLREAVSPGEIADIRAQMPAEFDDLFESGSTGALHHAHR
jgi:uncharacterized protein (DUF2267 family)